MDETLTTTETELQFDSDPREQPDDVSPDIENDDDNESPDSTDWRKQPRATSLWRAEEAFRRYIGLGSARSLNRLATEFGYPLQSVRGWSSRYEWPKRLSAQLERETDAVLNARVIATEDAATTAAMVLQSGYALVYRRVETLNDVARQIIERLARDGVYERRLIGVQEKLFLREKEVTVLRALLNDIAEETGGRVRTVAVLEEETIRQRILAEGLSPASAERIVQKIREGKR